MEVKAKATIPAAEENQCKDNHFSMKSKVLSLSIFTEGGER